MMQMIIPDIFKKMDRSGFESQSPGSKCILIFASILIGMYKALAVGTFSGTIMLVWASGRCGRVQ